MKYSELASKAKKAAVRLQEKINLGKAQAASKKAAAVAWRTTSEGLKKIDFGKALAALKLAIERGWHSFSAGVKGFEYTRILPRLKKEALLMWEHIVSLRSMRFSPEDPKLFWVSGFVFLLFQGIISTILWRVDTPWAIFTHQLSFNVDEFLVQRDNWGPEKVRIYLQHYWLDFIHPAAYALFFRCLLTQIQLSFPTQYVYHSLAFPIAAAIYDEIENICQLSLMAGWTESKFVFYVGAFSSFAKWLLLAAMLAAIGHAIWNQYMERTLEGK